MSKATAKAGKIVWIEPNKIDSISDTGTFDYEDYSICVDLEVRIPRRSACGTEDEVITFQLNTETSKDRVSFFTGTDGFLTTSFTDITANDPTSNKETLGVSSINITYNSYFYPQVTITFIDVRGSSLMYPQEDMFKNGSQGSFFKALFCFPYPQFNLKVKGFYGKQVQYELAVEDFRTAFNPDTGNFECTVKFIGYMYGIYADLPMSYLIVAPYTEFGSAYWNQMVANGIFVYDNGTPLDTFSQLRKKVTISETEVKKTLQNSEKAIKKAEYSKRLDDISHIDSLFSNLITSISTSTLAQVSYDMNDFAIASFNDFSLTKSAVINVWASLNKAIKDYNILYHANKLPFIGDMESDKIDDLIKEFESKSPSNTGVTYKTNDNGVKAIHFRDSNSFYSRLKDESVKSQLKRFENKEDVYGFIFAFNNFVQNLSDQTASLKKLIEDINKDIDNNVTSIYQARLGFRPTLGNIFKIIFAHLDVFMECYYDVLNNIRYDDDRTIENFELNSSNSDLTNVGGKVPPYPLVLQNVGDNKQETIWPGLHLPAKNRMIELKFVESLLKSIKDLNGDIDSTRTMEETFANMGVMGIPMKFTEYTTDTTSNVPFIPSNITDFYFFNNPYTEFVSDNDLTIDKFFSTVGYRLMAPTIDGQGKTNSILKGKVEAYNFFRCVNKLNNGRANHAVFINMLNDIEGTTENFIKYLTDGKITSRDYTIENYYHDNDKYPILNSNEYPFNYKDVAKGVLTEDNFRDGTTFRLTRIEPKNITYFWEIWQRIKGSHDLKGQKDSYDAFFWKHHQINNTKKLSEISSIDNIRNEYYKALVAGGFDKDELDSLSSTIRHLYKSTTKYEYSNYNRPSYSHELTARRDEDSYDVVLKYLNNEFPCYITRTSHHSNSFDIYGSSIFYLQNEIDDEKERLKAKAYLFLEYAAPFSCSEVDFRKITTLPYWYLLLIGARIWRMDEDNDPIFIDQQLSTMVLPDPKKQIPAIDIGLKRYATSFCSNKKKYLTTNPVPETLSEADRAKLKEMFLNWALGNVGNETKGFPSLNQELEILDVNNGLIDAKHWIAYMDIIHELTGVNMHTSQSGYITYTNYGKSRRRQVLKKYNRLILPETLEILETYIEEDKNDTNQLIALFFSKSFFNVYDELYGINLEKEACLLRLKLKEDGICKTMCDAKFDTYVVSPFIDFNNDALTQESLVQGFKTFLQELHTLYHEREAIINPIESRVREHGVVDASMRNNDLKLSLYLVLKNLYDRWLCGLKRDRWNYMYLGKPHSMAPDELKEKYEECEFNKFAFIDSFYNDVSSKISLNLADLKEIIDSVIRDRIGDDSVTPNGQQYQGIAVYQFMASILQKNSMNFLAVPCFNTYKTEKDIEDLFTPFSWFDRGEPKGTSYVGIYPHQVSAHLDIQGGEQYQYPNDGFDLADTNGDFKDIEVPDLANNSDDLVLPAFGVTYGKQDQSYFKKVTVNMDSPQVTEFSIGATLDIANRKGDVQKAQTFVGQDLYKVYSNHSYTCTVEMMGNAMITPLMYFQLNNIPMFKGAYMVIRVEHSIVQGNMTTTFTGVRMSKNKIPFVSGILESDVEHDAGPDNPSVVDNNSGGNEGNIDNGGVLNSGIVQDANANVNKFIEAARYALSKGFKEEPKGSNMVEMPSEMEIQGLKDNNGNGYQWCAIFVAWCSEKAGLNSDIINGAGWYKGVNWTHSYNTQCTAVYNYYKKLNTIITLSETNKTNNPPQTGDLILFNKHKNEDKVYKSNGEYGHIGIVESFNPENNIITYIHGNASDAVKRSTINYSNNKNYIGCFARPLFGGKSSTNATGGSSSAGPATPPVSSNSSDIIVRTAEEKMRLINAFIWQESGNKSDVVGDLNFKHHAYGILQIRQPMVDEINRIWGLYDGLKRGGVSIKDAPNNIERKDQVKQFISVMEYINGCKMSGVYFKNNTNPQTEQIPWSMEYCCAKWNGAIRNQPKKPSNPNYYKGVKEKYFTLANSPSSMPKPDEKGWTCNDAFREYFS